MLKRTFIASIFEISKFIMPLVGGGDKQGFPFENFGGGGTRFPPHLGKSVGGKIYADFWWGGKAQFYQFNE